MKNRNDESAKTAMAAAAMVAAARPSTVSTRNSDDDNDKRGKNKKTRLADADASQLKEAEAKEPAPSQPAPEVLVKAPPPARAAQGAAAAAAAAAVPPARAVVEDNVVNASVRALLETDLASENRATKVRALRTLAGYFKNLKEGSPADQRLEPYRRAVAQMDGCRKVLDALRQELAKIGGGGSRGRGAGGPNRDVVGAALRFVENWNWRSPEHRADTSRHGGAAAMVGAMRAFRTNHEIQRRAVACIVSFAVEDDAGAARRLRELVEADAMLQVSRAMMHHPHDTWLRVLSIRMLGRLREHGYDRLYDLYNSDAYEYLAMLCDTYFESDDPDSEELEFILRELVLEMLE